jgi:hypothetical protein
MLYCPLEGIGPFLGAILIIVFLEYPLLSGTRELFS